MVENNLPVSGSVFLTASSQSSPTWKVETPAQTFPSWVAPLCIFLSMLNLLLYVIFMRRQNKLAAERKSEIDNLNRLLAALNKEDYALLDLSDMPRDNTHPHPGVAWKA